MRDSREKLRRLKRQVKKKKKVHTMTHDEKLKSLPRHLLYIYAFNLRIFRKRLNPRMASLVCKTPKFLCYNIKYTKKEDMFKKFNSIIYVNIHGQIVLLH